MTAAIKKPAPKPTRDELRAAMQTDPGPIIATKPDPFTREQFDRLHRTLILGGYLHNTDASKCVECAALRKTLA